MPLITSSFTDDSKGRFSREAAVRTRRMCTSSSRVTSLPWTTCWNSSERTKSSCRWSELQPGCIGEPGGDDGSDTEETEDADDEAPEHGNEPSVAPTTENLVHSCYTSLEANAPAYQ